MAVVVHGNHRRTFLLQLVLVQEQRHHLAGALKVLGAELAARDDHALDLAAKRAGTQRRHVC